MFQIPDEVREEEYKDEDGSMMKGDNGKCGCCNWEVGDVYQMADTQEEANECFRENHRGLCGDCMSELIRDGDYTIVHKD